MSDFLTDAALIISLLVVGAAAVLYFSNWVGVFCAERFVTTEDRKDSSKRGPKGKV